MNLSDKEYIEELLPRYCEGDVTEEEALQVRKWMAESEENRRIVKQIQTIYLASETVYALENVDTEKALSDVNEKINVRKTIPWLKWIQQAAAILFIPLLIAFFIERNSGNESKSIQLMEIKTNPGMTTSFMLPDGTTVFLNSGSSLSYPSAFTGNKRTVALNGEAFFMVVKDKKKQFIVSTPHQSQIEVLGTSFNVDAYAGERAISTTLIEGKISFLYTKDGDKKKITLSPGQKVVYESSTYQAEVITTNGESETSWKDGKLIFANTSMEEALRMLEKRFNVEFTVKNENVLQNSFTGTFNNQRLERILEFFHVSSKINWKYIESNDISQEKSEIEIY